MNKKERQLEEIEELLEKMEEEATNEELHWPFLIPVSGLYVWRRGNRLEEHPLGTTGPVPGMGEIPEAEIIQGALPPLEEMEQATATFHIPPRQEEIRLDVDGRYPQKKISGTATWWMGMRMDWIADLQKVGLNLWRGNIWYKNGVSSFFPYTHVYVLARRAVFPNQRTVKVLFMGGGSRRVVTYRFRSRYFHPVEFEYDTVQDATRVTEIDTCAHPNRPASLPCETLSIEKVFRRAGFDVRVTASGNVIPLPEAGQNQTWSDMEMHDAMQTYWSRFANQAQWSLWVLFAALHDQGHSLGGIMFDDIGPNHRQGTAIFSDSFIADPPPGDPDPAAWTKRMRFWTACHEMGHCFNLAHSWQKALGQPWIPLANEPDAASFMNYPFRVPGGQSAFFADFEYRFSNSELLFMRHAPARFVQMGNADWFDHHGFQSDLALPNSNFQLEVRVNRSRPVFEFLEPVVVELKLKNVSGDRQIVDEDILRAHGSMTVIVKKHDQPARRWLPFARYCVKPKKLGIRPDNAIYESLLISTGLTGSNGWNIAEPGVYTVQLALHLGDEDIISNPLVLQVAPPTGREEEKIAQDFFSEDVGRVLTFGGTQTLIAANDTLKNIVERLEDRNVAYHARLALANPKARDYRQLNLPDGIRLMAAAGDDKGAFKVIPAKIEEARDGIATILEGGERTATTVGHVALKNQVDWFSEQFAKKGGFEAAASCQQGLLRTLEERRVLKPVLDDVRERQQTYKSKQLVTAREEVTI